MEDNVCYENSFYSFPMQEAFSVVLKGVVALGDILLNSSEPQPASPVHQPLIEHGSDISEDSAFISDDHCETNNDVFVQETVIHEYAQDQIDCEDRISDSGFHSGVEAVTDSDMSCDQSIGISTQPEDGTSCQNSAEVKLHCYERLLRIHQEGLRRQVTPNLNETSSPALVREIYKNRLTNIEYDKQYLSQLLQNYLLNSTQDLQLCESVSDTLDEATSWICDLKELYLSKGYYLKSQASSLHSSLPCYSKESQMNIFEFIRKFEAYAVDYEIDAEKTELLYSKFLCSEIQEEMIKFKGNYNRLKEALFHKYGDVHSIAKNLLSTVSSITKPGALSSVHEQLVYYRRLQFALHEIHKFSTNPEIPSSQREEYFFSQEFLHKLLILLPGDAKKEYIKCLNEQGEDIIRIQGKMAFKILIATVTDKYEILDASARLESFQEFGHKKPKKKKTNSKSSQSVHSVHTPYERRKSESRDSSSTFDKDCHNSQHSHDKRKCREFFQQSPKERTESRHRLKCKQCLVCLQSNTDCSPRNCQNIDSIPDILVCKDCKKMSMITDRPAYSIFYCHSKYHTKPSKSQISEALHSYMPHFNASDLGLFDYVLAC